MPPVPAFYHMPRSLDEVVDHTVARVLDQLGIDHPSAVRWSGEMSVGFSGEAED
jgi:4-hydroxy-3-polyprenylbenzoate decarboxylase